MKKLIFLLCLSWITTGQAQTLNTSNPRLWFWDECNSGVLPNVNWSSGNLPYNGYYSWTACSQNTQNQDPNGTIEVSTTYKRTGNYSYKHTLKWHSDYPCNGNGCQHLRNEWGILSGGTQTLANEWRWAAISTLIPPEHAMESRRYQIAFDHKEVVDYRETPFWLGIVGVQQSNGTYKYHYCLQGRYVPDPYVDLGEVQTGVWVDWLLERNWKTDNTGYMRFYKNGVLVWERAGQPNHESDLAPIDRIQHGFYKWAWANSSGGGEGQGQGNPNGTMVMYTDEIKFGKTAATLQDMLVGGTVSNSAPIANANQDQTITLPQNTTILNGSGTDADGTIVSYNWTKLSGPAGGNISSPNSATTGISALQTGTYVFQLRVTDNGGATGQDQMSVTVQSGQAPNQPPTVYAGDNKTITLPLDSVFMNSGPGGVNAADNDGTIVSYRWRRESGSGTIGTTNQLNTWIRGLTAGSSKFWLTVTDNRGDTATDFVFINVNPAPVPPNPPVVIAGPETQTITLPLDSAYVNGSESYVVGDSIQTYAWTKLSGPSGGSIRSSSLPATYVYALQEGTYVFRLIVTAYNTKKDTADLTVIVNAAPVADPPTVTIQGDSTRYIGAPIFQIQAIADTTGNISSILWEKVSGPGGSIVSASNDTTIIKDMNINGTYVFRVTVTDTEGQTATDLIRVIYQGNVPRFLIRKGSDPARQ